MMFLDSYQAPWGIFQVVRMVSSLTCEHSTVTSVHLLRGSRFNVDGALCDLIYIHSASTASHQLSKSLGAAILQTRSLLVLRPLSIVVP